MLKKLLTFAADTKYIDLLISNISVSNFSINLNLNYGRQERQTKIT